MKELKIKVLGKQIISFANGTLVFLRGEQTTKQLTISYQNGTGQTLTANQVIFTQGTINQIGFFQVVVLNNTTLTGNGSFVVSVTAYPTVTEVSNTKTVSAHGSSFNILCYYNSRPIPEDIEVSVLNRTPKVLDASLFLNNYSDYDNDTISEISFFGDVSGIKVDNVAYVEGTFIALSLFSNNKVTYTPNDIDTPYDLSLSYKIKDTVGNISN